MMILINIYLAIAAICFIACRGGEEYEGIVFSDPTLPRWKRGLLNFGIALIGSLIWPLGVIALLKAFRKDK